MGGQVNLRLYVCALVRLWSGLAIDMHSFSDVCCPSRNDRTAQRKASERT